MADDDREKRKLLLLETLCEMWDTDKLLDLMEAEYQRGQNDYRDALLAEMDARRAEMLKKFDPKLKTDAKPARHETAEKRSAITGDDRESMERPAERAASPESAAPPMPKVERPKPPEGRKDVGGQINPNRPSTLESNIELACMDITALGGRASGSQIQNWVRVNKWPDVPKYWNSSLYDLAHAGKLARDGINFKLIEQVASREAAQALQPAPEKKPLPSPAPPKVLPVPAVRPTMGARTATPQQPSVMTVKFEHNGKFTMLASSKQYVLAGKLLKAKGQGHISEAFLATSVFGSNTDHTRMLVKSECNSMNDALALIDLKIEFFDGYGLVMKDVG